MTVVNRGWVLENPLSGDDFEGSLVYQDLAMPELPDGAVLVRTLYISLDPANRGWMTMPTYIPQVPIGATMWGFVLGRVERSSLPGFAPGDLVSGFGAWADYCVLTAGMTSRLPDLGGLPLYAAQSLLGLSGGAAYVGVVDIAKPRPGEVFVVSGAAGSVGSLAGQIAKIHGCTVIGIAGSAEKCRWLTEALGFDHAIDYQRADVGASLAGICPNGINIYFDNVGGPLTNTVASRMALHGRMVLCGSMAKFANPGPELDLGLILLNRVNIQGFILIDHLDRLEEANAALAGWAAEGRLIHKADIVDGLQNALGAFRTLFTPGSPHTGKLLVRVDSAAY
jgi:NADPH-dependent curcumin reductase CurA